MSSCRLVCDTCHAHYEPIDPATRCTKCHGLLMVEHAPDLAGAPLRASFDAPLQGAESGVWRFADVVMPGARAPVSHPEGNTPLITRDALVAWADCDGLVIKHEGYNPTGSFKDRGMTVAITQAVRTHARGVVCASTGNTAASLSCYAAQAGLRGIVLVPAGRIAPSKLAQTIAYGAEVILVEGDFDRCLAMVDHAAGALGVQLLNSINPWRIEGQKTIILELLRQLQWRAPDWIVFPAGNLGNTAAFGKALREAIEWGLIDHLPRLAAVQAAGAAPFATAFTHGFGPLVPVQAETVASAIRIGNPASYSRGVKAIKETHGIVLSVSDAEILSAKEAIDHAGVGCEPASAASLAGVRALRRAGVIHPGQRVATILTGHLLKEPIVSPWRVEDLPIVSNQAELLARLRT